MDLTIVMAVLSLLTLICTLFVAFWTYMSQRTHNFNSVKPILQVLLHDFENHIWVRICNNGTGPAIITKVEITKKDDNTIRKNIIGYFEDLDWEWDAFRSRAEGVAISPNGDITLLEMQDPEPGQRDEIREVLKDLHMQLEYVDIYNRPMEPISRNFSWFGRNSSFKGKNKKTAKALIKFHGG